MTPITIMLAKTIGLLSSAKLLRVLLDSGTTKTMIHRRVLPKDIQTKKLSTAKPVSTLAGKVTVTEKVTLRQVKLPEFDKNRTIDECKALVFDSPCQYDVLIGADLLKKLGAILDYENGTVEWLGNTIPMRNPHLISTDEYNHMLDSFFLQEEEEILEYEAYMDHYISSGYDHSYAAEILDAKYEQVDIDEVVRGQTHLDETQKQELKELLNEYTKLFDGTLGVYPHKEVHIDVDPDAKPVHARAYPVPKIHEAAFKKELFHLVKLGMQKPTNLGELRTFLGAVNYYKDMWPSRAHVLKPLTDMTGKKKFTWTEEMSKSFAQMKSILAMDALSAYPDHNKRFDIYTDASDYQMGAVLMQESDTGVKRPVAYFSRKLNAAQKNYTTMEKELLSIVMTLKEFRTMLLGAEIHIHRITKI
ncbi:hypothetical protein ACHAWC_004846 [Mediolabrus comicus]